MMFRLLNEWLFSIQIFAANNGADVQEPTESNHIIGTILLIVVIFMLLGAMFANARRYRPGTRRGFLSFLFPRRNNFNEPPPTTRKPFNTLPERRPPRGRK